VTLKELLRRPEIGWEDASAFLPDLKGFSQEVAEELEIQVKYEGYLKIQEEQVRSLQGWDEVLIPEDLDYRGLSGLSNEIKEKLEKVRPRTLGQAYRISGVTPAAVAILQIYIKKTHKKT
jgi:tRNA uridine 5-carboxymethylaminomethyl modification enzyme